MFQIALQVTRHAWSRCIHVCHHVTKGRRDMRVSFSSLHVVGGFTKAGSVSPRLFLALATLFFCLFKPAVRTIESARFHTVGIATPQPTLADLCCLPRAGPYLACPQEGQHWFMHARPPPALGVESTLGLDLFWGRGLAWALLLDPSPFEQYVGCAACARTNRNLCSCNADGEYSNDFAPVALAA